MSSSIERKNPNFTDYLLSLRSVCTFWNSIHKFAGKYFKLSTTTTTTRSPTNANIIIDPLPTLPFDLITEILSRLPVKLLLQLRCVCNSWNSLISHDPKFARKHLTNSTTHSLNSLGFLSPGFLTIYPPNFFFNTADNTNVKRLSSHSAYCLREKEIVGSCNGILCIAYQEFILLWNPSIRKSKELPPLPNPHYHLKIHRSYGFGYDSVTDHYKVVVVLRNTQVKVNTLGTKIWKNIEEFPFGTLPHQKSGKYVSGTINWLITSQPQLFIVSLDLGNESYQKVLLPDYGKINANRLTCFDVLRDCLCLISHHDVWLLKEYGKRESWTKLFTISYQQDLSKHYSLTKVVYVFEDGRVLFQCKMPFCPTLLIVYDPRIGTFEFVIFPESFYDSYGRLDVSKYGGLVVCIESLISPCS